ncbi:MAG: gamma-glutamyltransferase family protein [Defluviitaleaceae bacterium]|nr:gamma-glutamyltransferase family protein [Defluviitaleaceae bacterium]MCL2274162.1 gamma-glutamyltransferase family protein [Defluviitaleaceae bacterium]
MFAKNGMVATTQPLAAQAGLDIIKAGGNAIDAAITTAACLTVVEPTSNGIGGDAFAIVWTKGEMHGLNASGSAPASISIEKVIAEGHDKMPVYGLIPVTVPGVPAAWAALNEKFGRLPLEECLKPAIEYARNGYPVSPVVAKNWRRAFDIYKQRCIGEVYTPWFDTFAPTGSAPKTGEAWASPAHANTLQEIAITRAESFYRGALAQKISDYSKKFNGFLNADDLAAFTPEWVRPVSVNYRGYDVWELPPNGQGIVALIALNILKGFDFPARDADAAHKQFEAIKLAFACGKQVITDPAYMQYSTDELLSENFAAHLRAQITCRAGKYIAHTPPKSGTVYLATADGEGNMVSYIQSNYMGFGSGIVIPDTGIALQNRGADFSLDPNHANALAGGKKTYHTIIPGFLTRGSVPIGPFGIMGGYMQPQAHVQVLMNLIDFNLSPQQAMDAPRWQWLDGKRFIAERNFPPHIAEALVEKGHMLDITLDSGTFGRGQIIWRNAETGVLQGGTEIRADGHIAGY